MRYISSPSHSSRFYHLDSIELGVQIMQLLIMQLPSLPVTSTRWNFQNKKFNPSYRKVS